MKSHRRATARARSARLSSTPWSISASGCHIWCACERSAIRNALAVFATLFALARLPQPDARDQPGNVRVNFAEKPRMLAMRGLDRRRALWMHARGHIKTGGSVYHARARRCGAVEDACDDRAGQVARTGRGMAALDCDRAQARPGLAAGPH